MPSVALLVPVMPAVARTGTGYSPQSPYWSRRMPAVARLVPVMPSVALLVPVMPPSLLSSPVMPAMAVPAHIPVPAKATLYFGITAFVVEPRIIHRNRRLYSSNRNNCTHYWYGGTTLGEGLRCTINITVADRQSTYRLIYFCYERQSQIRISDRPNTNRATPPKALVSAEPSDWSEPALQLFRQ